MSFSRYAIEKKQISQDRGVTWQDVDPSETRQGTLVDVYRTLSECEDAACDLEKTEYTVIDAALPNEICGDMIGTIPSGIVNAVTWTSGAICCAEWQSASPYGIDRNNVRHDYSIGSPHCIHDFNTTYCPSFNYTSSVIDGMEMTNFCFQVGQHKDWICPDTLCACFTIDSFMPWCEGKETWKLIQAKHYTREHCSEGWVEDGEPYICGIAERWKYVDESFERERWVHQVAKTFDDNGNVVTWESEGNLIYRKMTDAVLDPNVEILDYVINDGVLAYGGYSNAEFDGRDFSIPTRPNGTPSGVTCYISDYYNSKYIAYRANVSADSVVNVSFYNNEGWIGLFGSLFLVSKPNGIRYIYSILNKSNDLKTGKLSNSYGETIAFPCRIHENLGQVDDYWNSSQIGYVFRNGDGSMVVMETLRLEDGQLVKECPYP